MSVQPTTRLTAEQSVLPHQSSSNSKNAIAIFNHPPYARQGFFTLATKVHLLFFMFLANITCAAGRALNLTTSSTPSTSTTTPTDDKNLGIANIFIVIFLFTLLVYGCYTEACKKPEENNRADKDSVDADLNNKNEYEMEELNPPNQNENSP